uniref:Uncharacterized protein n=1 Tax=Pararge aegeria TaxID=116150 RepID=S4P5G0_9NEOP
MWGVAKLHYRLAACEPSSERSGIRLYETKLHCCICCVRLGPRTANTSVNFGVTRMGATSPAGEAAHWGNQKKQRCFYFNVGAPTSRLTIFRKLRNIGFARGF